jgi:hypothetical protein
MWVKLIVIILEAIRFNHLILLLVRILNQIINTRLVKILFRKIKKTYHLIIIMKAIRKLINY